MCMEIDREKTYQGKSNNAPNEYTFYKILRKIKTELSSPLMTRCKWPWKIKENENQKVRLKEKVAKLGFTTTTLDKGAFHAYVTKKDFIKFQHEKVVPIKVEKKDIIAFGINGEVAFKAFKIKNKDIKKALS